jgi:serum/glucocorticoid-regulated kinase 2
MQRDPRVRLGYRSSAPIFAHPFFARLNFQHLLARKIDSKWMPRLYDSEDTSHFDPEFTRQPPVDSRATPSALSSSIQNQFKNFSFSALDLSGKVRATSPTQLSPVSKECANFIADSV